MNKRYTVIVRRETRYEVDVEAIDIDNARIKALDDYKEKGVLVDDWLDVQHIEESRKLTDEEIENIFVEYADLGGDVSLHKCLVAYREVEQKLKEKNHGTT